MEDEPMKKALRIFAAAAGVFSLLLSIYPANATTISECKDLLSALQETTEGVEISGKGAKRERAALLSKLKNATNKLEHARLDEAEKKLEEYEAKVLEMETRGKIAEAEAEGLLKEANDTREAIHEIETEPRGKVAEGEIEDEGADDHHKGADDRHRRR